MSKIFLKAPEGVTDCSFGGGHFVVDNGMVEVPREAAEHLYQFGFANVPDAPETQEAEHKTRRRKAKTETAETQIENGQAE